MSDGMLTIRELIQNSNTLAREKGFWDQAPNFGEKVALIHAELSEALEEARTHGLDPSMFVYYKDKTTKPEGLAVELADAVIRLADLCGQYSIPLEEAIRIKHAYNQTRSYRHGKTF